MTTPKKPTRAATAARWGLDADAMKKLAAETRDAAKSIADTDPEYAAQVARNGRGWSAAAGRVRRAEKRQGR